VGTRGRARRLHAVPESQPLQEGGEVGGFDTLSGGPNRAPRDQRRTKRRGSDVGNRRVWTGR
jgi:hypothetical protein